MTVEKVPVADGAASMGTPAASVNDPAAEIVGLAAKLLRLQTLVGSGAAGSEAPPPARAGAAASVAPTGREAAVNSGLEVLRGFAISMVGELQASFERDGFCYAYQPIVSVASGALEGYEALLRWRRGEEEVMPALFMPLAAETRLLHRIQQRLLDDVAATLAEVGPYGSLSLNWSPEQLADRAIVDAFVDRLAQLSIDPTRLIIDVTQGAGMLEAGAVRPGVLRLKQAGCRIALDGFAGGFGTLSCLSRLPVDQIKIDGALINEVSFSARAALIVESLIGLGHRLGHQVVAKNVRNTQLLPVLASMGCDLAQGYAIGYPQRASQMAEATRGLSERG